MSKKNKKVQLNKGEDDSILDDLIEIKEKGKKQASSFYKDFKKFITKGNVLDLAVALVIGTAFNNIVKGLVAYIITPCLSIFTKGINMSDWKYVLKDAILDEAGVIKDAEIAILYGQWLQTIIDFIIMAFFIFIALRIIIRAKNKLSAKEIAEKKAADEKKKAEEKKKADEIVEKEQKKQELFVECVSNISKQSEILKDIRDILSRG